MYPRNLRAEDYRDAYKLLSREFSCSELKVGRIRKVREQLERMKIQLRVVAISQIPVIRADLFPQTLSRFPTTPNLERIYAYLPSSRCEAKGVADIKLLIKLEAKSKKGNLVLDSHHPLRLRLLPSNCNEKFTISMGIPLSELPRTLALNLYALESYPQEEIYFPLVRSIHRRMQKLGL